MSTSRVSSSELWYTVYFLFAITIISCIIVWNSSIHKDPRFTTILSLLTALTIFFTSFAIIIQLYTFHAQQTDSEIQIYDQMFQQLFEDSIGNFQKQPKLNYYNNEIFKPIGYKYSQPSERLYMEEQQITHLILRDMAAILYYIQNDKSMSQADLMVVKYKFNRFLEDLISSPTFLENYKKIKPTIYSIELRNYIQRKFNI